MRWRMPHWNALVDTLAYVGFVALAVTGLVMRFQLPPGSGGEHGGRGGAGSGDRAVSLLWGATRHDWGGLHYWIALGLFAVLAVHLALHWKWIVCMLRGKKSDESGGRFALGVAGLVGVIALGTLPFVTATESTTRGALASGSASSDKTAVSAHPDAKSNAFADLRGSNTLAEAADAAGVTVAQIAAALNLPGDTPPDTRFSSFIHDRGLSMDEVRQTLARLAGEPTADEHR